MNIRNVIKLLLPNFVWDAARTFRTKILFNYIIPYKQKKALKSPFYRIFAYFFVKT